MRHHPFCGVFSKETFVLHGYRGGCVFSLSNLFLTRRAIVLNSALDMMCLLTKLNRSFDTFGQCGCVSDVVLELDY